MLSKPDSRLDNQSSPHQQGRGEQQRYVEPTATVTILIQCPDEISEKNKFSNDELNYAVSALFGVQ
jgi:hypothetical protein